MKIYFASHLAGVKKQQSVYRLFSLVCGVQMPYFNQISCSKHGSTDTVRMLSGAVSIIALLASGAPALSQSFTILDGQVVTTPQALVTDDSVGTIDEGGVLTVNTDGAAVSVMGDSINVIVSGLIDTAATNVRGIAVLSGKLASIFVTKTGRIHTDGDGAWGIWVVGGSGARIHNEGEISTSGTGTSAILTSIYGVTIINDGVIATSGLGSHAISVTDEDTVVSNAGLIQTTNNFSDGVSITSNKISVYNSGTIVVSGVGSKGVYAFGSENTVTNSGTILADASVSSVGIEMEGPDGVVTNSGLVSSKLGDAIRFNSIGNNTLNLNSGNVIIGGLVFGGGTDTLNVANGLSLHYTFDKAPDILNTNGAPSLVQGNVVDVIDTTSFAHIDNSLDALLAGTFNMLAKPKTSNANANENPNALGYAQSPTDNWPEGADWQAENHSRVWANGFAGLQSNNASGSATQANTVFGGGVIGVESMLDPEITAGAFVGFGAAQLSTPGNTQTVDTKGQYAGLYGQIGDHIDLAVTGGVLQHASSRQILNNLAATGIETVTADFNGYFVAPEVTFNLLETDFGGKPTRTSLLGRYTFQHIDGYTENGADSILTVGARDIHALDTRLKVEADLVNDNETLVTARAGVDGQFKWGANSVTANLLGTNLTFDPGGAPISGSAFVGLTANKQLNENTNLYFDTELTSGTAHGFGITAQAGFKSSF